MNRDEKINFLKQLGKGTVGIKDLIPKKYVIRVCKPGSEENGYYIDGIKVTEEEFLERFEPLTGITARIIYPKKPETKKSK